MWHNHVALPDQSSKTFVWLVPHKCCKPAGSLLRLQATRIHVLAWLLRHGLSTSECVMYNVMFKSSSRNYIVNSMWHSTVHNGQALKLLKMI